MSYVCMGEHAFVGVHDVPLCLSGGQRLMLDVFYQSLSFIYRGRVSHLHQESTGWVTSDSQLALHFYLCFPLTKITGRSSCPLDIYMGAGDLISGSHVGLASSCRLSRLLSCLFYFSLMRNNTVYSGEDQIVTGGSASEISSCLLLDSDTFLAS